MDAPPPRPPPSHRALVRALVALVTLLSLAGYFARYRTGFCDFRAFYCAGRVSSAGVDPYREHPLHECERELPQRWAPTLPAAVTLPAPYPPATLALFGLVARAPFAAALALFLGVSLAALALTIVLVARTTATPLGAAVIAIGFPAVVVALPLGQPTPLIFLAIAASGAFVEARRPRTAGLAALLTLLDPHVGLAACCGVFAGVPAARRTLLAGVAGVAAANVAAGGPALTWEYAREVLPAHALANLADFGQFSVANLAFSLGVAPAPALAFAGLWSLAALAGGVVVGLRTRAHLGPAAVVFVPVAFTVVGGLHTHLQQLAFAIPAFLLATRAARGRRRAMLVALTFAASMPWLLVAGFPDVYPAVALLGVAFARELRVAAVGRVLAGGSLAVFALLVACLLSTRTPLPVTLTPVSGNPLAEVGWGAFVRAAFLPSPAWVFAAKLPTLGAFAALLTLLTAAATPLRGGFVGRREDAWEERVTGIGLGVDR